MDVYGGPNIVCFIEQPYVGTILRIETIGGKEYLFGMKYASTACRLIKTALAARSQEDTK